MAENQHQEERAETMEDHDETTREVIHGKRPSRKRRRGDRLVLSPKRLRQALILKEILSLPKGP